MVVNCGSPLGHSGEWRRAARLTDAHSTICLGQANASTIVDNPLVARIFGTPALMGPRTVAAQVQATPDGTFVSARHDGYVALFGIAVERRLWLSAGGRDVRGEDRFFADLEGNSNIEAVPFALRFHLHPAVKANLTQDGGSVVLVLPDRNGWRFSARGGRLRLEDSVYLLGRSGRGAASRSSSAASSATPTGSTGASSASTSAAPPAPRTSRSTCCRCRRSRPRILRDASFARSSG
jgi:uncharacterized heparinase superfamily protein